MELFFFIAPLLGLIGMRQWVLQELARQRRAGEVRDRLARELRWGELRRAIDDEYRAGGRFGHMARRRGAREAQYALHLQQLGYAAEALPFADRAIALSLGESELYASALATRMLALTDLGRYDEARSAGYRLEAIPGVSASLRAALPTLELYTGRLSEALRGAHVLVTDDPACATARAVLSHTYVQLGRYSDALAVLDMPSAAVWDAGEDADVSDVAAIYERLHSDRIAVTAPIPHLGAARVFLAADEAPSAHAALDACAPFIGPNPIIEFNYRRLRAQAHAALGSRAHAENELARAFQIIAGHPSPRLRCDAYATAGVCHVHLGDAAAASTALESAWALSLHPLERSGLAYWLGRAAEIAGQRDLAIARYQAVLADGLDGWPHARARDALGRLRGR